MKSLMTLTDSNFEKEVETSDKPVFIDFWSAYCQPCKIQMPIIEEIAEEYRGRLKVCKFEVGDNPEIPAKYQILSIPALAVFQNGKLSQLKTGLQNKEKLKKMIDTVIMRPTA